MYVRLHVFVCVCVSDVFTCVSVYLLVIEVVYECREPTCLILYPQRESWNVPDKDSVKHSRNLQVVAGTYRL